MEIKRIKWVKRTLGSSMTWRTCKGISHWPGEGRFQAQLKLTSEELLDVLAGMGGGELVDDVQRRLVVGIPDVDVNSGLPAQQHAQVGGSRVH